MRVLILLFLASVCLVFSGCPAYSARPLYTAEDAVVEPALEGTWLDNSDERSEFVFKKSDANGYSLVMSDPNAKVAQTYEVNLVRLGDQLFMDILFKEQTVGSSKINDPIGVVSGHLIAKVNIAGDDLAYAVLEDDSIQKPTTRKGKPLSYAATDGGLFVTASTADLRRYVSAHVDDGFSDWEHLTRKGEIQQ